MAEQPQQQLPPPPPPQDDQQQQQQLQQQQLLQQQQQLQQQQLLQQQQQQLVNPVQQPAGQVPIVQAQVVPGANGNMDLKIQQTKLPEFWGQKDKDSISANEFVKRVDKLKSANNWTEKVAFDNVGLALKGEANVWMDSQITLKHIEGDREQWSIIRPYFKEEFATESDDKLILDGLAHMAMRPTENVRSFFGRLNAVNKVIKDAYDSYTIKPAAPVPDHAGNISMPVADFQAYQKALINNVMEFNILNQFRAALLPELRRVINLQPIETLDLDTAVRLATIELRSRDESKGSSKIQAVQQDDQDENVEAISQSRQKKFTPSNQQNRGQQNRQNYRPQNNYRQNNPQQWRSGPNNNSGPGSNANRNKTTCIFCKNLGHRQEDCRKRINANKPCLDLSGKPFWPKINTTDNSAPIQALQDQDFQF
jgi:hypothetical protein